MTARRMIIPPGMEAIVERFRYAPGVLVGDTLYVSGQVGRDESLTVIADTEKQFEQCFINIGKVLDAAGFAFSDIVELESWFTSFPGPRPVHAGQGPLDQGAGLSDLDRLPGLELLDARHHLRGEGHGGEGRTPGSGACGMNAPPQIAAPDPRHRAARAFPARHGARAPLRRAHHRVVPRRRHQGHSPFLRGPGGHRGRACAALRADDYVVSHHRGHGHCIAKGADTTRMMAELMGRETGYCRASAARCTSPRWTRAFSGQRYRRAGMGTGTGAALSARMRGTDQVCLVFFGDGAANEGTSTRPSTSPPCGGCPSSSSARTTGSAYRPRCRSRPRSIGCRSAPPATGSPARPSTAMTCRRCSTRWRPPPAAPAPGRGRASSRPSPGAGATTPCAPTCRVPGGDRGGRAEAGRSRGAARKAPEGTPGAPAPHRRDPPRPPNAEIEAAIAEAKTHPEPQLPMLRAAVTSPHAAPEVGAEPGEASSQRSISMVEAIREAIDQEMARDPSVFVIGEDVGKIGGIFACTRGLIDKYGPERLRDAPIRRGSSPTRRSARRSLACAPSSRSRSSTS